jgi:hypothetical protein
VPSAGIVSIGARRDISLPMPLSLQFPKGTGSQNNRNKHVKSPGGLASRRGFLPRVAAYPASWPPPGQRLSLAVCGGGEPEVIVKHPQMRRRSDWKATRPAIIFVSCRVRVAPRTCRFGAGASSSLQARDGTSGASAESAIKKAIEEYGNTDSPPAAPARGADRESSSLTVTLDSACFRFCTFSSRAARQHTQSTVRLLGAFGCWISDRKPAQAGMHGDQQKVRRQLNESQAGLPPTH